MFAVDVYSHLRESHPETHVGYWVFPLPEGEAEVDVRRRPHRHRPRLGVDGVRGATQAAVDSWSNPDYVFDPVLGIQLVLRRGGRVVENRFVAGTVADPEVLRSYYHRVHAGHGYTPSEPFLFELHAAMLRRLERLFLAHIAPGSRGARRRLRAQPLHRDRPALAVHHRGRRRRPRPAAVAPGASIPRCGGWWETRTRCRSATGAFDALFAGELIEHLPDPAAGVAEFRRVLQPGGTLILTTPNRLRLANVADRSERPYSPDHLSELSYDEARALLAREGFEIVESTGVHLELLLNWLSPMPKLDRLQRRWNRPWAVPAHARAASPPAPSPRAIRSTSSSWRAAAVERGRDGARGRDRRRRRVGRPVPVAGSTARPRAAACVERGAARPCPPRSSSSRARRGPRAAGWRWRRWWPPTSPARLGLAVAARAVPSACPLAWHGAAGYVTADGALSGIVALRLRDGLDHLVFVPHVPYSGSLKSHLAAPLGVVDGPAARVRAGLRPLLLRCSWPPRS